MKSKGTLKISGINMRQFEKKYFETYSDAEIWMLNTTEKHDGKIRREAGKYYIFVEKNSRD